MKCIHCGNPVGPEGPQEMTVDGKTIVATGHRCPSCDRVMFLGKHLPEYDRALREAARA